MLKSRFKASKSSVSTDTIACVGKKFAYTIVSSVSVSELVRYFNRYNRLYQ